MKKLIVLFLVSLMVLSMVSAIGKPSYAKKVKGTDNVYDLGLSLDKGANGKNRLVRGYVYEYKKHNAKPGTVCGNGICEGGEKKSCSADCSSSTSETSCVVSPLSRSMYHKNVENILVNTANNDNLTNIVSSMTADIKKWEDAAGANIVGIVSSTTDTLVADFSSTDGKNEIYFGDYSENGVIAVTVVWGIYGGNPRLREIVEVDMIIDHTDFSWSQSGEASKMDLSNIFTHEFGHWVGLSDEYTSECADATMYGYASNGETKKQSLDNADKTAIAKLY